MEFVENLDEFAIKSGTGMQKTDGCFSDRAVTPWSRLRKRERIQSKKSPAGLKQRFIRKVGVQRFEHIQTVGDVTLIVLLVLGLWQLFSTVVPLLPTKMFPPPGVVFNQILADSEKIGEGIVSSLGIILEGFILGGASALVIGLVLGSAQRSFRAAEKVASFLSAIPPIVYIPYGIALLPTFRASSILVIFLATFWPVLTGTLAGVSSVDQRLIDSARVLNISRPKLLFRVTLPAALPLIFNGFNIGLCLSFILLTSAEMIGGSTGMGYYVKYYSDFSDYTRILAGIIVIGVVITIVSALFNRLQKYFLRWK